MSGQDNPEGPRQPEGFSPEHYTKIGNTLDIEGEISGQENLSIEGRVQGKIRLDQNNVIIQKNAAVKAEIHAKNVQIKGQVEGNIFASEKVHIEKGGHMNGDILASRITIDDGALFNGSVKIDTPNPSST